MQFSSAVLPFTDGVHANGAEQKDTPGSQSEHASSGLHTSPSSSFGLGSREKEKQIPH